jgi:hypothetical protein
LLIANCQLPIANCQLPIGALVDKTFTIPAVLAESNTFAIARIPTVIFLVNVASACSWSLVTVVAPRRRIASLGAIRNFGSLTGGTLAPNSHWLYRADQVLRAGLDDGCRDCFPRRDDVLVLGGALDS